MSAKHFQMRLCKKGGNCLFLAQLRKCICNFPCVFKTFSLKMAMLENMFALQGSCQTEVRYGDHNSIRINKKCKQIEACHNDKPQIYLFGSPVAVECIPGKNGEVCRCCCQRDGCNRNSSACSENSGKTFNIFSRYCV